METSDSGFLVLSVLFSIYLYWKVYFHVELLNIIYNIIYNIYNI